MKKISVILLLISSLCSYGQSITRIEYFIDTDPGYGNATAETGFNSSADVANFNFNVNLASVSGGVHVLYVRSKDANAVWSQTSSQAFVKFGTAVAQNISRIEYFFDTDPGYGNGTAVSFTSSTVVSNVNIAADLSGLAGGVHVFYVRAKDAQGNWSIVSSQAFVKFGSSTLANIIKLEYFFDTDPGFGLATNVPISPTVSLVGVNIPADITALSVGEHTFYARSKDANGNWSVVARQSFIKSNFVQPTLSLMGTLQPFVAYTNSLSYYQYLTVGGTNVIGNLTVTAPIAYQVSSDVWSSWRSSIEVSSGTTVALRYWPFSYSNSTTTGLLTVAGLGATSITRSLTGIINANKPAQAISHSSNTTVTSCGLILTSPNHPNVYSDNDVANITIVPTSPGLSITATYRYFHTEWDGATSYDRLIAYDGPSYNSTFIRQDYGLYNPPSFPFPAMITATNSKGVMTFGWVCNSSSTYRGWAIEIGCSGIPITNISEKIEKNYQIYPNPTTGKLIVIVNKVSEIKIINLDGKLIWQSALNHGENEMILDVSKGIYIIDIEGKKEKLVVE